jgi:2-polyprenyl-3-methyl-5-hydroxy-6-metoxy-1,4-benzoquinol methylase
MIEEAEHLEKIAINSLYNDRIGQTEIKYAFSIIEKFIKEGSILELGPAEGIMTELFALKYHDITVIEGSRKFCDDIEKKFSNVKIINSLFEDFYTERKYENIILGHVLEHVIDPVSVLSNVKNWLSPNGQIIAAVPNAKSLHRQAAVIMNLLKTEYELSELDKHHGHRRVYDPESFKKDFELAGLKVRYFGGYWLKSLSNKQIEKNWNDDMINAFMKLGEKYPEVAGNIYVVATLG